ncbi:MAG TPA: hypothetical protein VID50_12330 [Candidatus Eisenbacteria bacterium]|jgi:hypothetical protein
MISGILIAVIPALLLPWLLLPLRLPWAFAVGPVVPLAVVYVRAIAERKPGRAVALALLWAAALSIATVAAAAHAGDAAARGIWHAGPYRDEMLRWIATGAGAEGSPRLFLPRLLLEYAALLVLSAASGGVAGLLLGSMLLGYMNGYVGWVVANADPRVAPWAAGLLAWPPWPMARVASFVLAGTAAALWGWPRLYDREGPRAPVRRLILGSLGLLLLDIGLKSWLAPVWQVWLRRLLGASAGIEAGGSG